MSDRSRSRSRSHSPSRGRKIRTERPSHRDAPYRRDDRDRRISRRIELCKNCKRPGHFARECPNVAVCNNCGLPGWTAARNLDRCHSNGN